MSDFLGADEAAKALDPARLRDINQQLISRVLFTIESKTKPETPVRTGTLRRSFASELQGVNRGIYGSNLIYAPIVNRRNPYMDRGLAASSATIDQLVEAAGMAWVAS